MLQTVSLKTQNEIIKSVNYWFHFVTNMNKVEVNGEIRV